jgi:nucleoid-associated protein YgaU
MNATNPFQIPSCFQNDSDRRRRERFKRTFIAVVAGSILLLVGLLIEGCVTEHAKAASTPGVAADLPAAAPIPAVVMAAPKPVSLPQPAPQPVMSQSATAVPKANTAPAGSPGMVYTVKSGDNLSRIAKTHGTTVKAIEAANGLADDRIVVGTKLRMPQS